MTAPAEAAPWSQQVLDKVTGRARYPADEPISPCHYGQVLRSVHPHADVVVGTAAAEKVEGVLAVVDRPAMGLGRRVSQVGDAVAGVVATSPAAAEAAIRALEVTYDVLPAVTDADSAATSDVTVNDLFPHNVVKVVERAHGDVGEALATCAHRYSATYRSGRPVHYNLAHRCCFAQVRADGSIHVFTSVDAPFFARRELAHHLGLDEDRVVVEVSTAATSSFGGRTSINTNFEPYAVRLARAVPGTPVRLLFTPEEELNVSHSRHDVSFRIDAGCADDGRLVALDIEVLADHGAHPSFVTDVVLSNCRDRPLDLVEVEHYRYSGRAVLTHNPTAGEMRGIGVTQVLWAVGVHLDELSRRAGLAPDAVLRASLATRPASQPSARGSARETVATCMDSALAAVEEAALVNHDEGPTCRHGRGLAAGLHTSGLGTFHGGDRSTVRLVAHPDGTFELRVAAPDSGQGSGPAYRAITAEHLGVDARRVRLAGISTQTSPYDQWGSVASRGVFVIGPAVAAAARLMRTELAAAAAALWRVEPETVEVSGDSVTGPDGRRLDVAQLVETCGGALAVTSDNGVTTNPVTFGVCVADVCVDVETGEVQLLRAASSYDVGRVIDEVQCRGQLVGAFAMGWEHVLGGHLVLDDGRPMINDPYDHRFVRAGDLPVVVPALLESGEPDSSIGAKGIGTPAIVSVAPALANAIRDACGVRLGTLPITAEAIVRAMRGSS
jgi:CO/xanthine dehydrogenase Mo-binding subunit